VSHRFFDLDTFDITEYEYYEKVENGDMNWIIPSKFLAFSGPNGVHTQQSGIRTFTPEDYIPFFKKRNVTAIVRLNKKEYDRTRFTAEGINHFDLIFADGSAPTEALLKKFLDTVESQPGAIAVHCRAGLGRTGTVIAAYIIKHYHFSAPEAIAWIRLCRPGSVIGPQQQFLQQVQLRLWRQGEILKKKALSRDNNEEETISKDFKSLSMTSYNSPSTPSHNYNLRTRTAISNAIPTPTSSNFVVSQQDRVIATPKTNIYDRSAKLATTKFTTKSSTLKRTKTQTTTLKASSVINKTTLAHSPNHLGINATSVTPKNSRHSLAIVAASSSRRIARTSVNDWYTSSTKNSIK